MASLDGMRDRTITINGMSKTYSVTGWRVGWAIAPPEASVPIRKVHDFLTVGAAAPLQQAGAVALELPPSYYQKLAETYLVKRDRMLGILTERRFPLLQARRRVLHHDGYFRLQFSGRSFLSRNIWWRKSESPSCPARAFTTIRRWARARSASRSARKNRRWPPARKNCRSSIPDSVRFVFEEFQCHSLAQFMHAESMDSAPSANPARSWTRLDGVDLLRALAIFFVLMNHVNMRLLIAKVPYLRGLPHQLVNSLVWNGQPGVQIFFAVSGFLITSTTLRRWGSLSRVSVRDFYLLRFARIAPLLLIVAGIAQRPSLCTV